MYLMARERPIKAYCQDCRKELTQIGGDIINNSLYCALSERDCGMHELSLFLKENIGRYLYTDKNCGSEIIRFLPPEDLQRYLRFKEDISYSPPLPPAKI